MGQAAGFHFPILILPSQFLLLRFGCWGERGRPGQDPISAPRGAVPCPPLPLPRIFPRCTQHPDGSDFSPIPAGTGGGELPVWLPAALTAPRRSRERPLGPSLPDLYIPSEVGRVRKCIGKTLSAKRGRRKGPGTANGSLQPPAPAPPCEFHPSSPHATSPQRAESLPSSDKVLVFFFANDRL